MLRRATATMLVAALTAALSGGAVVAAADSGSTVVKEKDGVRVRLVLAADRLVAGEPAWLTTKVRNIGDSPVSWTSDGCGTSVHVQGRMVGQRWRRGEPLDVATIEADGDTRYTDFEWRAKKWSPAANRRMHLTFRPEWMAEQDGAGCADIAVEHLIAPGVVVKQRLRWDGQVAEVLGPPTEGTARITGTFGFQRDEGDRRRISVDLEVPVAGGRDPDQLHPREAVDAALADPAFRELVESVHVGHESEEYVAYDASRGAWVVGLCGWFDGTQVSWRAAVVDPAVGDVIEVIESAGGATCDEGLPPAARSDEQDVTPRSRGS